MESKAESTRRSVVGQGRGEATSCWAAQIQAQGGKETGGENDVEGGHFAAAETLKLTERSATEDKVAEDKTEL